MVLSTVDIKKGIIDVVIDFQSKIDYYQGEYDVKNKEAIEILSVAKEINKIIDALDSASLADLGIKEPKINSSEYGKLKRVLDLSFRYKTDLNAIAMDIGEKLSYSNQLLHIGVDYIYQNLSGKRFEKIAVEEFNKRASGKKEEDVARRPKKPVAQRAQKKKTGGFARLLFFFLLIGGGYYVYDAIFNNHATRVSSLVREYRSDKKLSEVERPVITKTLKISGSPSLVGSVSKWQSNFLATYKDLSVETSVIDSGLAIAELLDGDINIAAASRIPNLEERRKSQKLGRLLADHKVAMDAVAVFVHPNNPINELSVEDLKEIFTEGDNDFWKDFGGGLNLVKKYSPSPQSGTYAFFGDRVMFHEEYDDDVIKMIDANQIIDQVAKDPNAIGFASVSNSIGKNVKILAITTFLNEDRGVSPATKDADINRSVIKNGEYPLTRYLYLITAGELDDASAKFIDYFRSAEGQRALGDVGLVSIY